MADGAVEAERPKGADVGGEEMLIGHFGVEVPMEGCDEQAPRGIEGVAQIPGLRLDMGQEAPKESSCGRASTAGMLTVRGLGGDDIRGTVPKCRGTSDKGALTVKGFVGDEDLVVPKCKGTSDKGALTVKGLVGDEDLVLKGPVGDEDPDIAPRYRLDTSTTGALTVRGLSGEEHRLSTGMQLLARRSVEVCATVEILRSSSFGEERVEGAQQEAEAVSGGTGGDGDGSMLNTGGGTTDATHVGTIFLAA